MDGTIRIKANKIDIDDFSSYLEKSLTSTRAYLDPKKSKDENIEMILSLVKGARLYIDTFLTDTINQIRRTDLRKTLIAYFISVKFGIDLSCVHQMRRYVQHVMDGCVLIHCPSSSIVVSHDGRIKVPENQYRFSVQGPFLVGHKVHDLAAGLHPAQSSALGTKRYATDYHSYCVYSSYGDELIPCCSNPVSVGKDSCSVVKIWLNDVGYMLYPLNTIYKYYVESDLETIKSDYGYTEWIIKDVGGQLYHLTLSDCYLFDECKIKPGENGIVYSQDYEYLTDCSLTRPSIYDSPERADMMDNASGEDVHELLTRTAVEVERLVGKSYIVPVTQLDELFA